MLKKLVSLVVSVSCVLAATGVSAATYTGTVSEYVDGKISVTSYVSANAGDVLTYLAYDNGVSDLNQLDSSNVVYIDQKTALTTGETAFSYTTTSAHVNAAVKVGGKVAYTDPAIADGRDAGISPSQQISVSLNGAPAVMGDIPAVDSEMTSMVPVTVTGLDGQKVTGVKVNDAVENNYYQNGDVIYLASTYFQNVALVKIEVTSSAIAATRVDVTGGGVVAGEENAVATIGKVDAYAVEQGILFATSLEGVQAHTGLYSAGGNAFPALGSGTGNLFAVKLTNIDAFPAFAEATKLFARGYVKVGDEYVYSVHAFEINLAGGAE